MEIYQQLNNERDEGKLNGEAGKRGGRRHRVMGGGGGGGEFLRKYEVITQVQQ